MTFLAHLLVAALGITSLISQGAHGAPGSTGNCDLSQCPKKGIAKLYSELKCQPIHEDGSCCPVRYDCSVQSSRNTNKCHFSGEEYDIGSSVPSNVTDRNCLAACRCVGGEDRDTDFVCAHIECPDVFGADPLPNPTCFRQYSFDSCCSKGNHCPTPDETFQCEYNGKKYFKGQTFYPDNVCKKCICNEGYDGTTNSPWCKEFPCSYELIQAQRLRRGCVPVFFRDGCCPISWHCPSESDKIIEGPNHGTTEGQNEASCNFGNLKLDVGDKLRLKGLENVDCSCTIPPYVSCSMNPKQ